MAGAVICGDHPVTLRGVFAFLDTPLFDRFRSSHVSIVVTRCSRPRGRYGEAMLTLKLSQRDAMVAACIRALPNEGCGLLLGTLEGLVHEVVPSPNIADSAKVYEIDPTVFAASVAARADDEGLEVIGVFHSHTHSEAYPSPTDVRQAPDATWPFRFDLTGGLSRGRTEAFELSMVSSLPKWSTSASNVAPKLTLPDGRGSFPDTTGQESANVDSAGHVSIKKSKVGAMSAVLRIPTVLRPAMGGESVIAVEGDTVGGGPLAPHHHVPRASRVSCLTTTERCTDS